MKTLEKIKLWKDNRNDNEYTLKYLNFLKSRDLDWIQYYGHQTVSFFIGERESNNGLQSVIEQQHVRILEEALEETRQMLY